MALVRLATPNQTQQLKILSSQQRLSRTQLQIVQAKTTPVPRPNFWAQTQCVTKKSRLLRFHQQEKETSKATCTNY
jgi:hypothetical protein